MSKLPPFIQALEQWDPELLQTVSDLKQKAMGPGALDPKTKTLIALALDAVLGAREGVASLSAQARNLGANDAEIAETLRVAYFVAGNGTLATAGAAFTTK